MQSIRSRLALWYGVAMAATLGIVAVVVFVVQRSDSVAELDKRVRLKADLIAAILAEAYRVRGDVVVADSATGNRTLAPDVAELLQGIPGFVVVLLHGGNVLFLSAEARALTVPAFSQVFDVVRARDPTGGFGVLKQSPTSGEVRYFARAVREAGPDVAGVVAGLPASAVGRGPQRLLSVMLLIAPFIIAVATVVGYVLVGHTLKPVELIVDEVEAITDGRSLHRRLAESGSQDELGRLSSTLNRMLARLERSFMSLRRFTADASHELKTPLTVLRSGIERAITHPKAPPEVMEVLEEPLVEANRMRELVDSLLTLARVDEGRAPLHLVEVDLREVLSEIAETAGILGEQARVEVAVDVPAEPLVVRVDPGRIRQLLMNLLTNAIKYTPAGGRVWITSATPDGQVVLTVRDTGIGIAPGDLPHVFDRFWRADPARSRAGERAGTGLGLAICKWIAEAHGGGIAVQSRPGRGTAFTVTFPVNRVS